MYVQNRTDKIPVVSRATNKKNREKVVRIVVVVGVKNVLVETIN